MRFFRNLKKEDELFDRELAIKRREAESYTKLYIDGLEIDRQQKVDALNREVFDFKARKSKEIEEIALACAKQTGEYEHTFHSTKEKLGIELAKLEAKKEALTDTISIEKLYFERMLEDKNKEIERLNAMVSSLIQNQPDNIIQVRKI
ncbi:MAG: hypothetical protein ABI207_05820 [Crocinitomicaceae bacterium]